MIIIANIFSFIAMIIMCINGIVKNKKKFVMIQLIQIAIAAIANILLGATTGVIINSISIIRNYMVYKNNFTLKYAIITSILSAGLSIYFNNLGFIGILPLFSTIPYTFLMQKCNDSQMKYLTIWSLIPWCVYDFYVKNYVAFVFDCATIITCIIGLFRIKKSADNNSNIKGA